MNITVRYMTFLLSSRDEAAIQQIVIRLKTRLEEVLTEAKIRVEQLLDDFAYTLSQRRSKFPWSTAISACR